MCCYNPVRGLSIRNMSVATDSIPTFRIELEYFDKSLRTLVVERLRRARHSDA